MRDADEIAYVVALSGAHRRLLIHSIHTSRRGARRAATRRTLATDGAVRWRVLEVGPGAPNLAQRLGWPAARWEATLLRQDGPTTGVESPSLTLVDPSAQPQRGTMFISHHPQFDILFGCGDTHVEAVKTVLRLHAAALGHLDRLANCPLAELCDLLLVEDDAVRCSAFQVLTARDLRERSDAEDSFAKRNAHED